MLAGSIEIKGIGRYTVLGKDSFNDLRMQLTAERGSADITEYKAINYFDSNTDELPESIREISEYNRSVRRLDVKKVNKYKSNITNKDMAIKISALIRYMQIAGKANYNQNIDEDFKAVRLVNIKTPDGVDLGYVKYNMGTITELISENAYCKIELKTVADRDSSVSILGELKAKDKFGRVVSHTPIANVGFKLSSDDLYFEYQPEVKKEDIHAFGLYQTIEEVIENNPDKNTEWILHQEYHIVTDETLNSVMRMFYEHKGFIAFDTETSGLKINFKSRTNEADQLVGVVLSRKKGEGYYFPLQHKSFENLCGGDHFYFMDKYMRKLLETRNIICHNLSFDWKVAHIYDINVNCVYDTMLALGVTKKYEDKTYEIGLKAVTKNIFGRDSFDLSDFMMGGVFGENEIGFWDLPYELVRQYAPADTDNTFALFEFLEEANILNKYNARLVFGMEITFSKAVAYSEFYGYHLDVEKIPELREKINNNMTTAQEQMFKYAGEPFNASSPAQLASIMYDKLNIEEVKGRSTDKEALKILAGKTDLEGNSKYPFVRELKTFRDNEGINKNFLKKLPEFSTQDGYIFPEVMQLGTTTGRVSVKNPNYQSYNDTVKKFIVPRPDFIHFDSDFSQIEQRVLCSYACIMFPDEPKLALLRDFDDPDMDYHQYQAARMFNVPYAAVSKGMRQQSKGINFGLPYGMGDDSLGARIFGERSFENTKKAEKLREKFFQGQELIDKFFNTVRAEGVKNGYTSTQWGRRRYYDKSVFTVAAIRRQAGNHVIQGSAADIYKIAVNNMFERICKEGWLGKVLINGFIHDEILLEVHKSINPYYFFKAWREEFEVRPANYCKLYAGAGVGHCWYDAKKQDLPPMFIEEVINEYEDDMPWDEDHEAFLAKIQEKYERHKERRVMEYIQAEEHKGEIIKPAIGALLSECVGKIQAKIGDDKEYAELLGREDFKSKISDLQEQLKVFCKYFGIDYSTVHMLNPEEVVVVTSDSDSEYDYYTEDDIELEINTRALMELALRTQGIVLDYETMTVHMVEFFSNTKTPIKGTEKLVNDSLLVPKELCKKGYKICYYSKLEDELTGVIIPDYVMPEENFKPIKTYYTLMLDKGIGRLSE